MLDLLRLKIFVLKYTHDTVVLSIKIKKKKKRKEKKRKERKMLDRLCMKGVGKCFGQAQKGFYLGSLITLKHPIPKVLV